VTAARTTAQAQLERLLYILPAAARQNGVRVAELARALDVEPDVVLRDLREATARSFNQPAGAVDSFTLLLDGSRVHVHAPHEFNRPVRLDRREALALGLGLRALAADEPAERAAHIRDLARRLEVALAAPAVQTVHELRDAQAAPELEYEHELTVAFGDDGFRGVVVDAIELGRVCTLVYLKPGADAPRLRRIAPHRLIHASGLWYVAGHDLDCDAVRFFRMDRVLDAALEEEAAPAAPASLDDVLRDAPFSATDDVEVSVRYSQRVARWIVERVADTALEDDGTVVVRYRVADPRWIVRHVLQYGGDAVIEGPAPARQWVTAAAGGF
jgi:proteasome accessory factor C